MAIEFRSEVWKEGKMYVAYSPELDVSSCGPTLEKAKANLKEAVELFLEEAEKMGTLPICIKTFQFLLLKIISAPLA